MASPFPGMDPYLEDPHLWPDFHHRLAVTISEVLNQTLPGDFFAQLEQRLEVGIVDEQETETSRYIPDVSVNESGRQVSGSATAVLDRPRVEVSPNEEWDVEVKRIKHLFVEVREVKEPHRLVTLIEILSPSNKRSGKDRDAYAKKQSEIIASDASLIEIDLLQTGQRILPSDEIEQRLHRRKRRTDYLVVVGRAWNRTPSLQSYQVFPFTLRDPLPCIPVPLREGGAEPLLDLQFIFQRLYDAGPYRRGAVNYSQPPNPPLSEVDSVWASELLAAWKSQR